MASSLSKQISRFLSVSFPSEDNLGTISVFGHLTRLAICFSSLDACEDLNTTGIMRCGARASPAESLSRAACHRCFVPGYSQVLYDGDSESELESEDSVIMRWCLGMKQLIDVKIQEIESTFDHCHTTLFQSYLTPNIIMEETRDIPDQTSNLLTTLEVLLIEP